jgi:hypothetical protein
VTDPPGGYPPVSPREDESEALLAAALEGVIHGVEDYPVVALQGRITAGLGVQLLWSPLDGQTYLTCTLNGECDTFAVPPEQALDAFAHPYSYGCTLPL